MSKFDNRLNQLLSLGFAKYNYYVGNEKYMVPYHEIESIKDWDDFIKIISLTSTK
jgi:hypothetical protein